MTYTLETRSCHCGCGATFRVLPTSRQQYVSKVHQPAQSWRAVRDEKYHPVEDPSDLPELDVD